MTTKDRKKYAEKIRLRYFARNSYDFSERSKEPSKLTHDALAEVIIRLLEIEGRMEDLTVSIERPLGRIAEALENSASGMSPERAWKLFQEAIAYGNNIAPNYIPR